MNTPLHCGESLCFDEATHECAVIGGPTLHFCAIHAQKMIDACAEAGVSAKIAMRPIDAPAPEAP